MADPFLSAKQKVARARELIATLDSEIRAFNATEPHERTVETDPEGLVQDHTVKLIRPLPDSFAQLTRESAAELRVALDRAVFAASKAAGSRRLLDTCFPIAEGPDTLDKLVRDKCQGVPQEIMALIREFKPFKGENELIWGLSAIGSVDEYALIVPVGSVDSGLTFINNKTPPRVRWDAKRREIQLGTFPIHGKFHPHINILFSAAFGAIEGLENRPVLPVLQDMSNEVERIIGIMETETCRLGSSTD